MELKESEEYYQYSSSQQIPELQTQTKTYKSRANNAYSANLKLREDIARAAYKVWFRIKPGHREIKDQWWALYYKKVRPEYHCRDNHLGRKINSWIEIDLKNAGYSNLDISKVNEGTNTSDEEYGKKRKAMSSKEGILPAYINVELVHPPKYDPSDLNLDPNIQLLMKYCEGNDLDWSRESLEEDVHWFRDNREKLMNAIPLVNGKQKATAPPKSHPMVHKRKHEDVEVHVFTNVDWIYSDLYKSNDTYFLKVDLPGMIPGQDFFVLTDDVNKILVKGEKKSDVEKCGIVETIINRAFGSFQVELVLPLNVDLKKTEQTFSDGVLTIKCPVSLWATPTNEELSEFQNA